MGQWEAETRLFSRPDELCSAAAPVPPTSNSLPCGVSQEVWPHLQVAVSTSSHTPCSSLTQDRGGVLPPQAIRLPPTRSRV